MDRCCGRRDAARHGEGGVLRVRVVPLQRRPLQDARRPDGHHPALRRRSLADGAHRDSIDRRCSVAARTSFYENERATTAKTAPVDLQSLPPENISMKKLAIGCLLVLVVGGVAAAGGAYYLYYRVKSTVSQFAELGKIPQIEAGVRIQTPFLVPTTGDLTQSQVDRFVQVQTKVRERLGRNFEDLQRK